MTSRGKTPRGSVRVRAALAAGTAAMLLFVASRFVSAETVTGHYGVHLASDTAKTQPLQPPRPHCEEALDAARTALRAPMELDDAGSEKLHVKLVNTMEQSPAEERCAEKLLELAVTEQGACGRALETTAIAALERPTMNAEKAAPAFERGSARCPRPWLVASQHVSHTDMRFARAVEKAARSDKTTDNRMLAWLSLGAMELVAKDPRTAAPEVAKHIDASLTRELSAAKGEQRMVMLEAAGNGACTGCLPAVEHAMKDDDEYVRRAAIGAWRWHAGGTAIASMCKSLASDKSPRTRDQAAWALRWKSDDDKARVACLAVASKSDADLDVRLTATHSLIALVGQESEAAFDALLELKDEPTPWAIRKAVWDWLATKDERIRAEWSRNK